MANEVDKPYSPRMDCRVVIEGVKLSGKSSAMRFLESDVRGLTNITFRSFHSGKSEGIRIPDLNCLKRVHKLTDFALTCLPHPVAISRLHLYAHAIISPYQSVYEWFCDVDSKLHRENFLLVLLDASEDAYFQRLEKREREERAVSSVDKRRSYFLKEREGLLTAFNLSKLRKVCLDTSDMTTDDLKSWLLSNVVQYLSESK